MYNFVSSPSIFGGGGGSDETRLRGLDVLEAQPSRGGGGTDRQDLSTIIDHRSSLDYLRFLVGDLFSLFSYLRSVEYYCENPKVLAKDKNLGVRYTRPQPFLFSG
jgi:hypothetical protein